MAQNYNNKVIKYACKIDFAGYKKPHRGGGARRLVTTIVVRILESVRYERIRLLGAADAKLPDLLRAGLSLIKTQNPIIKAAVARIISAAFEQLRTQNTRQAGLFARVVARTADAH